MSACERTTSLHNCCSSQLNTSLLLSKLVGGEVYSHCQEHLHMSMPMICVFRRLRDIYCVARIQLTENPLLLANTCQPTRQWWYTGNSNGRWCSVMKRWLDKIVEDREHQRRQAINVDVAVIVSIRNKAIKVVVLFFPNFIFFLSFHFVWHSKLESVALPTETVSS